MGRYRRVVVGFSAAALVVVLFMWVVGWRAVVAELARVDPAVLLVGFAAVPVAFFCWTEAFRTLLAGTGYRVGGLRYRAAYLSGEFAKQVIPMGQAGGPVLLSYAVSSQTDSPYQGTLAAATVFTLVNITVSLFVATSGLTVYLLTRTGPLEPVLVGLLGGLVVGTVGITTLAVLVWSQRGLVERLAVRVTGLLRRTVGRLSERVRLALDPDRVQGALETYYEAFDAVAADRRQLLRAAAFAAAAWAVFLVPMYTSFRALGVGISYPLVLFVVPVVVIVNLVPLPGGLGGFEIAVAGTLTALTGIPLPVSTAGVFLYRLSNYWFVVLMGGLASTYLSVRLADHPDPEPLPIPEE